MAVIVFCIMSAAESEAIIHGNLSCFRICRLKRANICTGSDLLYMWFSIEILTLKYWIEAPVKGKISAAKSVICLFLLQTFYHVIAVKAEMSLKVDIQSVPGSGSLFILT